MSQSVNVTERLRKARISFVTTNSDVANAHPSPSHAALAEALVDTLQDDTGRPRQRHELATMEIQGADENILIRPGSGTAQGSEGAADATHWVYHKRIDTWSGHLRAESLQEALNFKPKPTALRPELEKRRTAAYRTWTRFRPVWFRPGVPLRVRRLFSRGWWSPLYTQVLKLFAFAPGVR